MKNKLMNFILERSNSYQYYKSHYEKYNASSKNKNLNLEIKKLKNDINKYKKTTDSYIDSCNFLFNNIYLDYDLKPKKLLNNIQLLTSELLEFVGNVCDKYDLEWWLDYGNLLGAVRHGDYVPWDDDADIGMMRKDYIKFENIIEKEIEENNLSNHVKLTYNERKINGKRVKRFITIRMYYYMSVFSCEKIVGNLDIFPYDFINDYNKNYFDELYIKSRNNLYENIINDISKKEYLKQYYEELNLNLDKTELFIPGVDGLCGKDYIYDSFILESNKLFPLGEIKFANKIFPCPNDTHSYLDAIYGDYMKIPKSLHRHRKILRFRYNENNDELFENCINMLKEVNCKY